jgi:hypothetical protein
LLELVSHIASRELASNVTSNEKLVSDHLSELVSHIPSRELVNNDTSNKKIASDSQWV